MSAAQIHTIKRKAESAISEQDLPKSKKIHKEVSQIANLEDTFAFDLNESLIQEMIFWEQEEEDYLLLEDLKCPRNKKKEDGKMRGESKKSAKTPNELFYLAILQMNFLEKKLLETFQM